MFTESKITDLAVNLVHVRLINVEEIYPHKYAVKVWLSPEEWYSIAEFDKKEDAVRYKKMICKEYNEAIKVNKYQVKKRR